MALLRNHKSKFLYKTLGLYLQYYHLVHRKLKSFVYRYFLLLSIKINLPGMDASLPA